MARDYSYSEEVEKVANEVIPDLGWRERPNIQYLMLTADSCDYMGKCSKSSKKMKFLTDKDYVIEVWETAWNAGDAEVRKALMYHELLHIEPETKKDGTTYWGMRRHDCEEFCDVAEKYGAWDHALKQLLDSIAQYNIKGKK
jgi:Putative phage metallopeptidase